MKLDTTKIVQSRLKSTQYFQEETPKNQIYLHHTAGNGNAVGVAKYWDSTKDRIATAFIIGNQGTIVQCFSSREWAYHLGLKNAPFSNMGVPYKALDKNSVGIEVCNWGMLKEKNGKFYNYVGGLVDDSEVTELDKPFKGYTYWHKYTDKQIESLRQLVVYLCETYDISKEYNDDIWDLSRRAMKGEDGIFTHNSVRKDKSDMYPCPRVIEMLKNL
jgi:N-acetyl-anhydromuramyl-L-alanine amidase AmpD